MLLEHFPPIVARILLTGFAAKPNRLHHPAVRPCRHTMKLLCETTVQYRQGNGMPSGPAGRSTKSTLALGTHPPNSENAELFIILFTPACMTGTRYKVRDNLERVFTKFLAEGKATISLKQPAHDLQIRCDAVQLRCFLQALKLGLQGKKVDQQSVAGNGGAKPPTSIRLGSLTTTAIPLSAHPVSKLVVRSRGDYPLRGLPKTLRTLQVNGIQRVRFDTQILFLKQLTTLNLNDNHIAELPKQLGQLRLQLLDMGRNRLGERGGSRAAWQWLDGQPLQETLHTLSLSGNGLAGFPFGLVKMRQLTVLKLDDNAIERLPFAVRRMRTLKFLHLSNNKLSSLPSTISCNSFNTIDLSGNPFAARTIDESATAQLAQRLAIGVPQLWECAARVVAAKRLPYSPRTLPITLIDLLEDTPLCSCGLLCFSATVQPRSQRVRLRSEHVIFNGSGSGASEILCDAAYCSRRCLAKYALR